MDYENNDAYEADNVKFIQLLSSTTDMGGKRLINLLRQSMWVGNSIIHSPLTGNHREMPNNGQHG